MRRTFRLAASALNLGTGVATLRRSEVEDDRGSPVAQAEFEYLHGGQSCVPAFGANSLSLSSNAAICVFTAAMTPGSWPHISGKPQSRSGGLIMQWRISIERVIKRRSSPKREAGQVEEVPSV